MPKLLFLCTGNYYRSRFAEYYFRHAAASRGLGWGVDSRGLALDAYNTGHMYHRTERECERLGLSTEPLRHPLPLELADLESSDHVIAVKEAEHRPLLRDQFHAWEDRVEYWTVHDLDAGTPEQAFPLLRELVDNLIERLLAEA